jgi:hypothetical protein
MSIATWKKAFFNQNLQLQCEREDLTQLQQIKLVLPAIDASIKKWDGVKKINLKKHRVFTALEGHEPCTLTDKTASKFELSGWSCPLCALFTARNGTCVGCPLAETGNGCGVRDSAYPKYASGYAPASTVVSALKKARRYWVRELIKLFPSKKEQLKKR